MQLPKSYLYSNQITNISSMMIILSVPTPGDTQGCIKLGFLDIFLRFLGF